MMNRRHRERHIQRDDYESDRHHRRHLKEHLERADIEAEARAADPQTAREARELADAAAKARERDRARSGH